MTKVLATANDAVVLSLASLLATGYIGTVLSFAYLVA